MTTKTDLIDCLVGSVPVLDQGFVRLVDCMPRYVEEGETGDDAVVRAARVSYGNGTKRGSDNRALIRYLMRHRHTSPFEMVEFTFHIKAPIFVARQWMRHRTGSFNEISARYSVLPEEFYLPDADDLKPQSSNNKQGRNGAFANSEAADMLFAMQSDMAQSHAQYQHLLGKGLARELARTILPVATYTEFYWKVDLLNLLKFLHLRNDNHAQFEIREYAAKIEAYLVDVVPFSLEAFHDYWTGAPNLSSDMWTAMLRTISLSDRKAMVDVFKSSGPSKREIADFEKMLGVQNGNEEG